MEKNWNIFSMSFMKVCPCTRHYHSDLSIWLSVDPMSDKYPSTSPYVYCANNPIIYKDPNGLEKIISYSTNTGNKEKDEDNQRLVNAANSAQAEDPVIHLFAHGAVFEGRCWGIFVCDAAGEMALASPQEIQRFLLDNSEEYRSNQYMGNTSILILHSCMTGQDGSIAEKTSREFNNLLIIAPSDVLNVRTCGGESYENGIEGNGTWNLYYKGEKLDSFNELPIINDTNTFIHTYEEKYANSHPKTDID